MSRIDSGKVNLGSSFVLSNSDEDVRSRELVNAQRIAAEIIAKAQQQAQGIVADAQKDATSHMDKALSQANGEVDSIVEKARQEGYEKGYAEGRAQIEKDLSEQIENLEKFTKSQFDIKKRIIKSAHNDIVNLVVMLADKICQKRLELDKTILFNMVKYAIVQLRDKESVTLIVNPSMAKKMYDISDALKNEILSLKTIKIIEDVSVSEDGAIVESISSRVDSRVSSQIDEVSQRLLVELQSVAEETLVEEAERAMHAISSQNQQIGGSPMSSQYNVNQLPPQLQQVNHQPNITKVQPQMQQHQQIMHPQHIQQNPNNPQNPI